MLTRPVGRVDPSNRPGALWDWRPLDGVQYLLGLPEASLVQVVDGDNYRLSPDLQYDRAPVPAADCSQTSPVANRKEGDTRIRTHRGVLLRARLFCKHACHQSTLIRP